MCACMCTRMSLCVCVCTYVCIPKLCQATQVGSSPTGRADGRQLLCSWLMDLPLLEAKALRKSHQQGRGAASSGPGAEDEVSERPLSWGSHQFLGSPHLCRLV